MLPCTLHTVHTERVRAARSHRLTRDTGVTGPPRAHRSGFHRGKTGAARRKVCQLRRTARKSQRLRPGSTSSPVLPHQRARAQHGTRSRMLSLRLGRREAGGRLTRPGGATAATSTRQRGATRRGLLRPWRPPPAKQVDGRRRHHRPRMKNRCG